MTQTKVLSVGVLALGLIVGGIWGLSLTFGSATQAAETPTSRLEQLNTEIAQAAQEEFDHGCVEENSYGRKVFCGESKERMDTLNDEIVAADREAKIRSAGEVAESEDSIRTVTGNSDLDLTFENRVSSPYSSAPVEYYTDSKNTMYMVNPDTNKVVAFTYNDHFVTPDDEKLSEDELRDIAHAYLTKNVEDFDQVESTFTSEEGSKGDMYVFRYNAPKPVAEGEITPFVQVKLSAGGDLIGFSDIRSLF